MRWKYPEPKDGHHSEGRCHVRHNQACRTPTMAQRSAQQRTSAHRLWSMVFDVSIPLTWFLLLVTYPSRTEQRSTFGIRTIAELSSDEILALSSSPDPVLNLDPSYPASHLARILIPRARTSVSLSSSNVSRNLVITADTENNTIVRQYITSTLKALDWHVEEDSFVDNTPIGKKKFTNVIATKDPTALRRVILSAHFDSKYFPSYPQNQVRGFGLSGQPFSSLHSKAILRYHSF